MNRSETMFTSNAQETKKETAGVLRVIQRASSRANRTVRLGQQVSLLNRTLQYDPGASRSYLARATEKKAEDGRERKRRMP